MSAAPPPGPRPATGSTRAHAVNRRGFLLLAGGLATGLVSACSTPQPTVLGGPTAPPARTTPPPPPELKWLPGAITHEVELAHLSRQLSDRAQPLELGAGPASVAGWMASAHDAHATALLAPRPTLRPTAPPDRDPRPDPPARPTPTARLAGPDAAAAVASVTRRLDAAGADYRAATLDCAGPVALLWGSLAAYVRGAALALGRDVSRPTPTPSSNRPVAVPSDVDAAAQTLTQVHALVYGYQSAIGVLEDADAASALETLARRRALRDRLAEIVRDGGRPAPAAEPAYALPVVPRDRASAGELIWRMETVFATYAGPWLAATTTTDTRRLALDTLVDTVALGVSWGGPLPPWPGWPN